MRIKRPLCLLSALAMALSLSACGPEATEELDTPILPRSPSPSHNIAPPDSPLPSEDQVTFASASAFVLEAIPLWDQVALEEGESAAVLDASGTRVLVVTYSDYLPDDPALQELGGGLRSHRLLICDWESGEVVTEVSISQEPAALCTDGVLLEQRNGPYFQLISDGGQALFMTDTNQNAAVLSFPEGESGLTLKKEGVELPNGAVTFCPLTPATCLAASGDGVPALYLITALP